MDSPQENLAALSQDDEQNRLIRRAELIISSVLRGGVILSAAIITIGVISFYLEGSPNFRYPNGQRYPNSIPAIWYGLTHGDPRAIVTLGLVLLLATPVVRVAVSTIAFAASKDRLYVAITLLVLAILIFSFLSGLGGG